jgi:hypothetical protein
MNLPEITFTNYKEPLREVKEGYGYLGTLGIRTDDGKLQCHICGECFDNLAAHTSRTHGVSKREYKRKFKIAGSTRLVSDKVRLKLSKNTPLNGLKKMHSSKLAKEKARKATVQNNKSRKGKRESLEIRNKKGSCPDQLIQKILDLKKKLGKTPSIKEFKKEYGSTLAYNIYQTYGSYPNAIRFAGLKQAVRPKAKPKYTESELLAYIKQFYEVHGRTPREVDFSTYKMPSKETYRSRFGSINKARFLAGAPVLEGIGRYAKEVFKQNDFDLI